MKQFETVEVNKPKSSAFDLSHEVKLTGNMADLLPVFCEEVIPGDRFIVKPEVLLRMQPLLAPIMHRVNAYMHFFFVPNRLIWHDWEDFITGGADGLLEPNHPKLTGLVSDFHAKFPINSLGDYLGLPVTNYGSASYAASPVSQLPFRAYLKIYNDYYVDQTLKGEVAIPTDSNDMAVTADAAAQLLMLRRRCWEKDYFTSALPTAQRGNPVKLPLVGDLPVSGRPNIVTSGGVIIPNQSLNTDIGGDLFAGGAEAYLNGDGSLSAKLDENTATTVSELRTAFSLQRWMEKMARGGARYIEQMLVMFGVKSSDSRLQRSEYLGGGRLPIQIAEVLQTSETNETPQGNMSGHGISSGMPAGFSRYFEEHGFVIGILSVLPRTGYFQGIPKIFSKFDRFDYFWPDFAHIGEQPVTKGELYAVQETVDEQVFGYQPRYSEYRYKSDVVRGDFRDSLLFWHMARKFDSQPSLNSSFVEANPTTRIYPVEDETYKKLLVTIYFDFKAIRPIPKFGNPI